MEIVRPLIALIFAAALLYFLWGVIRYIQGLSKGDTAGREAGRLHMIYGIIGIAIMLSVYGIIGLIYETVTGGGTTQGITGQEINRPPVIDGGL